MSFNTHESHMITFCHKLKQVAKLNTQEQHLHDLLEYICANKDLFESSISNASPFYTEFFANICAEEISEGTAFALLECLIIFCRERQLQQGDSAKISALEAEILRFYEQSHHWHVDDNTLMHQWYWHTLPLKYGTLHAS